MGRLKTAWRRRGGLLGRPLLLFALLLLGPAAGFCILGWTSLVREHEFRLRDMQGEARRALDARLRYAADELERIRERESRRHYYEYQGEYLPQEQVVATLAFQSSPLNLAPRDPLVRGWFQWELFGSNGTTGTLEILPASAGALQRELTEAYGEALLARLQRAPESVDLRTGSGRVVPYPQRVVAANEERGQLQEELALQGRQGRTPSPNYLDNFETRAREAPVRVRYTDFRYLVRRRDAPGPPLVAWRMVWVPPEQTQWREVKRDRWILQGYALDPASLFPETWSAVGSAQVRRADRLAPVDRAQVLREALPDLLGAEIAGVARVPGALPPVYDPSLVLASQPNLAAGERAWIVARNRFLLLVAGLVIVVALGFFVLARGVRREVGLVRRKEDFIAAITHELKTPLTGIRMYADMMREGWVASPEAAGTYADRILDETKRLGHLVDQVLDLAALERGVAALNARAGDLGEAVRGAVALMETRAAQADVRLEVGVPDDLPPVTFDPRLVRPLVLNLLDNAIKYSARAAEKSVTVTLRREGERVVLRVADRGVGIAPAARKGLFEPFRRAGDELTRAAPGVGIGLALVKRYADAHRARVVIQSEPGVGTTVEVRFPL